ncbi:hypothetical protein ACFSJY_12685 [Thalassotalea euphylliae]|uniref:hypothetical protein n=1 Tax=Thalassotalea euphylliae TaxID=1655234 RepID=UPI003624CB10
MYKRILAVVTVLSLSQASLAADRTEIWNCVNTATEVVNENCMMATIEKHTESDAFFDQLAKQTFEPKTDAFATITRFPAQNLIVVKSIEAESETLLAANK